MPPIRKGVGGDGTRFLRKLTRSPRTRLRASRASSQTRPCHGERSRTQLLFKLAGKENGFNCVGWAILQGVLVIEIRSPCFLRSDEEKKAAIEQIDKYTKMAVIEAAKKQEALDNGLGDFITQQQVYASDVGEQLSALEGVLKDEQMQWLKTVTEAPGAQRRVLEFEYSESE